MGIIKAITMAIGGSLADQWLEVIEPGDMGDQTVFIKGTKIRKGSNAKGSDNSVSNGSVIHVYPNQFMMVVDGGRVVDYTAEEGYYTVDNSSLPSLFNGEFKDTLKESFSRIKYGGETPTAQKVFYINLQEIKNIKFGTRNPVNYFDNFYNAELFLRAHGAYSIKITDPLLFYAQVIPKNQDKVEIGSINNQYMEEFLEALQVTLNQMSADGERISFAVSKGGTISKYMADALDEGWKQDRGFEVMNVGLSISYDEQSQKLLAMRNQGAMLGDPTIREGYVQGAMARGMEAAGSNAGGAVAGFMGMGAGMNAGGGFMGAASAANMQQMQMNNMQQNGGWTQQNNQQPQNPAPQQPEMMAGAQSQGGWTCGCGNVNSGKFCSECGQSRPDGPWTCGCGNINNGKFCSECGKSRS
ncbi:MAG: SPFH domain-containing protein [Lachnospiraceae bacterium]